MNFIFENEKLDLMSTVVSFEEYKQYSVILYDFKLQYCKQRKPARFTYINDAINYAKQIVHNPCFNCIKKIKCGYKKLDKLNKSKVYSLNGY